MLEPTTGPVSRRSTVRVADARANEARESEEVIAARGIAQRSTGRDKMYESMGMRRQGDLHFLSIPNLPGPKLPKYSSRAALYESQSLEYNMRQQMISLAKEHERQTSAQLQQRAPLDAQVIVGPPGPPGSSGRDGRDGDQGPPGGLEDLLVKTAPTAPRGKTAPRPQEHPGPPRIKI